MTDPTLNTLTHRLDRLEGAVQSVLLSGTWF